MLIKRAIASFAVAIVLAAARSLRRWRRPGTGLLRAEARYRSTPHRRPLP